MSWFYEAWSVPSEKNGRIDCRRVFGQWVVLVDGCNESSGYIRDLWRDALRRIPRGTRVKRVLILGLAAGSSIALLHRRYPHCQITAIEWDPVMVEVMDRLALFPDAQRPKILLGDAEQIVSALREEFDLILFDLYQGSLTPKNVGQRTFFESLRPLLSRGGSLLVNAYTQPETSAAADAYFSCQSSWKYRYNLVSFYKPFGAGTIGDPLPSGYVPYRSSSAYLRRDIRVEPRATAVGTDSAPGVRRWVGPGCIEKYFGDEEPTVDSHGPRRLVIWQPTCRPDRPKGWHRSRVQMNASKTGFVDVQGVDDPLATWSPHARRHVKHWLAKQDAWEMIQPTLPEFLSALMANDMRPGLKNVFQDILTRKTQAHGDLLHLTALRRRKTGLIEAGFASLDVPEIRQSIHIASYVHPSAKGDSAGTGLMYQWFLDAKQRNIRFLDFDLFRGPGDPKSWEGFSRFKSQFGTHFIRYPHPLTRWIGTWRAYVGHFGVQKKIASGSDHP